MKSGGKKKISTAIVVALVIFSVFLLAVVGYFVYDKIQQKRQYDNQVILEEGKKLGMQEGYKRAIVELITQASTCNVVPVWYDTVQGNVTLHLVAVECLQKQQAAEEQAAQQSIESN